MNHTVSGLPGHQNYNFSLILCLPLLSTPIGPEDKTPVLTFPPLFPPPSSLSTCQRWNVWNSLLVFQLLWSLVSLIQRILFPPWRPPGWYSSHQSTQIGSSLISPGGLNTNKNKLWMKNKLLRKMLKIENSHPQIVIMGIGWYVKAWLNYLHLFL